MSNVKGHLLCSKTVIPVWHRWILLLLFQTICLSLVKIYTLLWSKEWLFSFKCKWTAESWHEELALLFCAIHLWRGYFMCGEILLSCSLLKLTCYQVRVGSKNMLAWNNSISSFIISDGLHGGKKRCWKYGGLLPNIQTQVAPSDDSDLKHISTERFHCFLANMLGTGNILQFTSFRFQQENLANGDLHRSGNTTLGNIEKYEACLSVDIDSTVR